MLGVSRQSISKWENSDALPTYDILLKVSHLLNESIDDLFSLLIGHWQCDSGINFLK